jgi:hypothetical protein
VNEVVTKERPRSGPLLPSSQALACSLLMVGASLGKIPISGYDLMTVPPRLTLKKPCPVECKYVRIKVA